MTRSFQNANEAYEFLYQYIPSFGVDFADTKAIFNCGFYIENPLSNFITNADRKWSAEYAVAEWNWYLSGDPSINKLGEIYGKIPPIWERMADEDGDVNSNYGWQWRRNKQLDKVVEILRNNPESRQAAISIYDGKEIHHYRYDTPCTYAVQFTILNGKLDMSVFMRSNDLWYGFCNDQYCFSMLQAHVADRLDIQVGEYFHFAHNMHIYNDKLPT